MQPVAIKQMLHTDQKAKEDFLNEIQLLKHVSLDANVLQYYGATIKDEYLWLVTEYMEVRMRLLIYQMRVCKTRRDAVDGLYQSRN